MAAKKRVRKPARPKVVPNLEVIRGLFAELKKQIDIDDKCPSSIFDNITTAEKDFFMESNKKELSVFQHSVAVVLRKTPKAARPNFDNKIGFFIWVTENVPDAMEKLRLIDKLEDCPDEFRTKLEHNYEEAKYKY